MFLTYKNSDFCWFGFVLYNLLGQSTLESFVNLNFDLGSSLLLISSSARDKTLGFSETRLNTLLKYIVLMIHFFFPFLLTK